MQLIQLCNSFDKDSLHRLEDVPLGRARVPRGAGDVFIDAQALYVPVHYIVGAIDGRFLGVFHLNFTSKNRCCLFVSSACINSLCDSMLYVYYH